MKVKVWSPQHLSVHADNLCRTLNLFSDKVGIEAVRTNDVLMGDAGSLYILYCPQVLSGFVPELVPSYIVYNTEHALRFLEGQSNRLIFQHAKQVWCHTQETAMMTFPYSPSNFPEIVPPGVIVMEGDDPITRPYDITFCGTMNARRYNILKFFSDHGLDVNIITQPGDIYGQQMLEVYRRSKIVLNLHFENGNPLELFRIHEALSCGCKVISEWSAPALLKFDYSEVVHFFHDKHEMVLWAEYLLNKNIKLNFDIWKLDNIQYVQNAFLKL